MNSGWQILGSCFPLSFLFKVFFKTSGDSIYLRMPIYLSISISIYLYLYLYLYLYIYRYRDSLVKSPQWEPSVPQQLNTNVIRGGVWIVHNFCETCTTSCKRGQLLWIRWQVLKHCKKLIIRLYPYIYNYISLSISIIQYLYLYIHMHIIYNCNDIYNHLPKIVDKSSY